MILEKLIFFIWQPRKKIDNLSFVTEKKIKSHHAKIRSTIFDKETKKKRKKIGYAKSQIKYQVFIRYDDNNGSGGGGDKNPIDSIK